MSFSSLLQIALIAENQANKYQTHNDAVAALEQADNAIYRNTTTGSTQIDVSASNMMRYTVFKFSGATGARIVTFPSTTDGGTTNTQRKLIFWNNTVYDHTVKASTGSGSSFIVKAGHLAMLYIDHEDVISVVDYNPSPDPLAYDPGIFIPGMPTDGANSLYIPATRQFTLPSGLTGSQAACNIAPTADATFTIKKNITSVGTVKFTASTGVPVFTFASSQTWNVGDLLVIVNPSPQDSSLSDVGILFKGSRV